MAASEFKLKPEAKGRKIVFKGSGGKTVDQLDPDQLRQLVKIGVQGNDKTITSLFEGALPTAEDFAKEDAADAKKDAKGTAPAANNSNKPQNEANK